MGRITDKDVLEVLEDRDRPMNATELSRIIGVSRRTVMKRLKRMVKTGRIHMYQDFDDMRLILYCPAK